MNKKEYSEYCESVERELEGLSFVSTGICPDCAECGTEGKEELDDNDYDEPSFSWSSCECCGSNLGGDRHKAHAVDKDNNIIHFEVCSDCLYYINYGRLDDQLMIEIEKE